MCDHLAFDAEVRVHRLVTNNSLSFVADLGIVCRGCGAPFAFQGVLAGVSALVPTVSADHYQIRLPLAAPFPLAPLHNDHSRVEMSNEVHPDLDIKRIKSFDSAVTAVDPDESHIPVDLVETQAAANSTPPIDPTNQQSD